MPAVAPLAAALILAQASDAARTAAAAEKAAQAAQAAAEAAARAAAAAERAAQGAAARAPEAAPPAAPAARPSPWSGSAAAGFTSLTGNGRALLFTASAAAERKTEGWIAGARTSGAFGQARPAGGTGLETSALAAALAARIDRRFTPATSAYALGAVETDHVKSVEARYGLELGTGVAWLDSASGDRSLFLRTDLGVRVQDESRFRYYPTSVAGSLPGEVMVAPRFAVAFRWRPGKEMLLSQEAEVLPDVKGRSGGPSRVMARSVTRVAARLLEGFHLGVGFTVEHDSAPAPGKVPTDTLLATTLEALF
jgi:hypothetical protein